MLANRLLGLGIEISTDNVWQSAREHFYLCQQVLSFGQTYGCKVQFGLQVCDCNAEALPCHSLFLLCLLITSRKAKRQLLNDGDVVARRFIDFQFKRSFHIQRKTICLVKQSAAIRTIVAGHFAAGRLWFRPEAAGIAKLPQIWLKEIVKVVNFLQTHNVCISFTYLCK